MTIMSSIEENTVCIDCECECYISPINSDAADSLIVFCPYCGQELVNDEDETDKWIEGCNDEQWDKY